MNDPMRARPSSAPAASPGRDSARPAAAPIRRSPATRIVLSILLVVALAATAWVLRRRASANGEAAAAAGRSAADRTIAVLTTEAVQRDVPIWREGLGTVAAFYTVTVKPQVDGRIDRVFFKEGQAVKQGDLLVQIDPRPFRIQLLSAQAALLRDQAQLNNGRLNEDRYKTLTQQNLIAQQQYTDQAAAVAQLEGQIQADQAAIEAAKLNIDYARITSPIDGIAGVRLVDPGNVVHASDPNGLVVVTQLDPIALLFTLPEDDRAAIATAMAAGPLTVEAFSRDGAARLGEGKLTVIDNQINQATASIRLKAIFANPKATLWPNEFVKARLRLATRKGAIVIPASAVQRGPQGTFVYVVAPDSTAMMRPIDVALTQGDVAVVAKGVNAGDAVVVEGQAQLRPAAKVAAKPAPPAPHEPAGSAPNDAPGSPP